jgi:hypothetical protein
MKDVDTLDLGKCRQIAYLLLKDYSEKEGVFKQFKFPPEYNLPNDIKQGSEQELLFLTLTVSLDYGRDATKLWKQSYDAWLSKENKWIFTPKLVVQNGLDTLANLFKSLNDQKPNKDAKIWFTICKKLLEFEGSIYNLLKQLDFDAVKISKYLEYNKKEFPYLSGPKIKPLWLRMINDTVRIKLKNIEQIPLPVDTHTAKMTFKLIFKENFRGKITKEIREKVQKTWQIILNGTGLYSLQLDEPLWLLGKYELLEKFAKEHDLD